MRSDAVIGADDSRGAPIPVFIAIARSHHLSRSWPAAISVRGGEHGIDDYPPIDAAGVSFSVGRRREAASGYRAAAAAAERRFQRVLGITSHSSPAIGDRGRPDHAWRKRTRRALMASRAQAADAQADS